MKSYFKNIIPFTKKVNEIPLAAVYTGILSNEKQEGNITVNLRTGIQSSGGFILKNTKVNPVISGIWSFFKKKIPENVQNIVRKEETDPFRNAIKQKIKSLMRRDVDLAPEDSKRWKNWMNLFENNKEEFFNDNPELKEAYESTINLNNSEMNGGYKKKKRRKLRKRKTRRRKSRKRKTRRRKSRKRKNK